MKKRIIQKEAFLQSEADAWHKRNKKAVAEQDFAQDIVVQAVTDIASAHPSLKILEIGCGAGHRLSWLAQKTGVEVHGIEPSAEAVSDALDRGVAAVRGTADSLPYETGSFDVIIFGFCLYLCDRQDLFQIAKEADRVLNEDGWLIIQDFFAKASLVRDYHHMLGITCHKMDYRKLFDWHPSYTCFSHQISHHATKAFTDDPQEWVATSVMRKMSPY